MQRGPPQGGDDGRHHGAIKAVFRRHARERGERHALGQHYDGAHQAGDYVRTQAGAADARPPGEKRKNAGKNGPGGQAHDDLQFSLKTAS